MLQHWTHYQLKIYGFAASIYPYSYNNNYVEKFRRVSSVKKSYRLIRHRWNTPDSPSEQELNRFLQLWESGILPYSSPDLASRFKASRGSGYCAGWPPSKSGQTLRIAARRIRGSRRLKIACARLPAGIERAGRLNRRPTPPPQPLNPDGSLAAAADRSSTP